MASYYLAKPKDVHQKTNWTCWAAALESWSYVVPQSAYYAQADVLDMFSYLTDNNGGLPPLRFPSVAQFFAMKYEVVRGSDFGYSFIETTLCWFGHMYVAYNRTDGSSHAVVVYGAAGKCRELDGSMGRPRNHAAASFFSKINAILAAYPSM